jgi:hypothetical protein
MPTRASKPTKAEQDSVVHRIVAEATGDSVVFTEAELRSQAASILGKLGASKGGKARAKNLSAERRKQIAKKAAISRWSGRKKTH